MGTEVNEDDIPTSWGNTPAPGRPSTELISTAGVSPSLVGSDKDEPTDSFLPRTGRELRSAFVKN
jgi:hypothetical protein